MQSYTYIYIICTYIYIYIYGSVRLIVFLIALKKNTPEGTKYDDRGMPAQKGRQPTAGPSAGQAADWPAGQPTIQAALGNTGAS